MEDDLKLEDWDDDIDNANTPENKKRMTADPWAFNDLRDVSIVALLEFRYK